MAKSKVLVVGATGETGMSIIDGLLEAGETEVQILVRPASADKPAVSKLKERGVTVQVAELKDVDALVPIYKGIDTVISAVSASSTMEQMTLVDAASKAGVKRFLPCAFMAVAPPGGVMNLRDEKELVYQHVRKLRIPYTIVDVGFWHQLSFPTLPSGRVNYASLMPSNATIFGDENAKTAITDLRDIGRYVAKIIMDGRTLNKYVFCYGEVLSQKDIFMPMEELSGEKLELNYMTPDQLAQFQASIAAALAADPTNFSHFMTMTGLEYCYSKFIRGDNTPEYAKYLGYLDGRDLYPDFKPRPYRDFVKELLDGKAVKPYAGGAYDQASAGAAKV